MDPSTAMSTSLESMTATILAGLIVRDRASTPDNDLCYKAVELALILRQRCEDAGPAE